MRLYKSHTIELAKQDLLNWLARSPEGLHTSELIGTPNFHGVRTLAGKQIIKLLRAMPDQVVGNYDGTGCKAPLLWKLKMLKFRVIEGPNTGSVPDRVFSIRKKDATD